MKNAFILASGLCWTATYVLIIWRGFADRTYGMPIVALAANLSWEFIFSVLRPPPVESQHVVNIVWLAFDLVLVYTVLRYGPREFPHLPKPVFYAGLLGTLVIAFLAVDLVSREFDNGLSIYAAFFQNLLMSGLFLSMLSARRGLAGQSAWIAGLKLVGTACAFVWVPSSSSVLVFVFAAIMVLDVAYLAAVLIVGRRTSGGAVTAPEAGARRAVPVAS